MKKTREMISREIAGMTEPQLLDYIEKICEEKEVLQWNLDVARYNLSIAMEGGNECQVLYEKVTDRIKELEDQVNILEQAKKSLEEQLILLKRDKYTTGGEWRDLGNTYGQETTQGGNGQNGGTNNQGSGGAGGEQKSGDDKKGKGKPKSGEKRRNRYFNRKKADGSTSKRKPPVHTKGSRERLISSLPKITTYLYDLEKVKRDYPDCTVEPVFKERLGQFLHRVPAYVYLEEVFTGVIKVTKPNGEVIFERPKIDRITERGLVTEDFMASLIYDKVFLSLPTHRDIMTMNEAGCPISDSMVSTWNMELTQKYLIPVYNYMLRVLFSDYKYYQLDETRWRVVSCSKSGYVFVARTTELGEQDEKTGETKPAICCYIYREDRTCEFIKSLIKDGYHVLITDGYSGYIALEKDDEVIIVVAMCWVHLRRKLIDAYDVLPSEVRNDLEALKTTPEWLLLSIIGNLFRFDTPAKKWDRDHRRAARQQLVQPFVNLFMETVEDILKILAIDPSAEGEDDEAGDDFATATTKEFEGIREEELLERTKIELITQILDEGKSQIITGEDNLESALDAEELDAIIEENKAIVASELERLGKAKKEILAGITLGNTSETFKKALGYAHNHVEEFLRFLIDENIPADNSASERLVRLLARLRDAIHVTRNLEATDNLLAQMTLCVTARENNANPYVYLIYLFRTIAHYNNEHFRIDNYPDSFLETLMPWSKEYREFEKENAAECYRAKVDMSGSEPPWIEDMRKIREARKAARAKNAKKPENKLSEDAKPDSDDQSSHDSQSLQCETPDFFLSKWQVQRQISVAK